jgi:DNA-binding transcriptional MerR regulator
MRLKKTYSSREVAALTGLTARQLQLWDAGGLLSPSVPSHKTDAGGYTERRYTPIELFELLVLADLRHRGFTVHQLHEVVRILQDHFRQRLFDATGGGGSVQLLTDGRDIYARTAGGEFFNLLKTPTEPLLIVGDETTLKELSGKLKVKRKKVKGRSGVSGSEKSSRDRRPVSE